MKLPTLNCLIVTFKYILRVLIGANNMSRHAKRINIVQVKLVRENVIHYKDRKIKSPEDAYHLMREYLGDADREHFVVLCLDTKNQPTCIQTVHIGSLNASIIHPREVLKSAILSNAASIIVGHNHRATCS